MIEDWIVGSIIGYPRLMPADRAPDGTALVAGSVPAEALTAKGRRTRQRIVAAAAGLVFEQGVAGTTIEDVQAAARVSTSQLYHYFPSKNAVVRAVIQYQEQGVVGAQEQALAHLDTLDGLRAWADAVVDVQRRPALTISRWPCWLPCRAASSSARSSAPSGRCGPPWMQCSPSSPPTRPPRPRYAVFRRRIRTGGNPGVDRNRPRPQGRPVFLGWPALFSASVLSD